MEVKTDSKQARKPLNTGLNADARKEVVDKLSIVLADKYLLMLKTHNYHWNVRGPLFKSIHDLTEGIYDELFEAIDEVAERIRALGYDAPGTFGEYSKLSKIKEAGGGSLSAEEMIEDMLQSHELIINDLRDAAETAADKGDVGTEDMMIARMETHEKTAWMLRSYLEK